MALSRSYTSARGSHCIHEIHSDSVYLQSLNICTDADREISILAKVELAGIGRMGWRKLVNQLVVLLLWFIITDISPSRSGIYRLQGFHFPVMLVDQGPFSIIMITSCSVESREGLQCLLGRRAIDDCC